MSDMIWIIYSTLWQTINCCSECFKCILSAKDANKCHIKSSSNVFEYDDTCEGSPNMVAKCPYEMGAKRTHEMGAKRPQTPFDVKRYIINRITLLTNTFINVSRGRCNFDRRHRLHGFRFSFAHAPPLSRDVLLTLLCLLPSTIFKKKCRYVR